MMATTYDPDESEPAARLRIFEDVGGYLVCDDRLDHLDARGTAYPTKAAATRAAILGAREWGLDVEYVTGSGVSRSTARHLKVEVR